MCIPLLSTFFFSGDDAAFAWKEHRDQLVLLQKCESQQGKAASQQRTFLMAVQSSRMSMSLSM